MLHKVIISFVYRYLQSCLIITVYLQVVNLSFNFYSKITLEKHITQLRYESGDIYC